MVLSQQKPIGILIAIEGIDGSGKTIQAQRVQERLEGEGFSVVRTKEPTDGVWGTMLRNSAKTGRLSSHNELHAFLEDRKEHVEKVIKPALSEGNIVIVDRYFFSTAAYQGALGLGSEELLKRNEVFAPIPDLLVYLRISEDLALSRIRSRDGKENLFEQKENLKQVKKVFDSLKPQYVVRIDGSMPVEAVTDQIVQELFSLPGTSVGSMVPARWVRPQARHSDYLGHK